MGLDTTHNCWHGPYSSFNNFRYQLAKQIGINLDEYEGYRDKGTKDLKSIPHDIMPLLDHSDCDGELSPDEATQVASGLTTILKEIDELRGNIIRFRNGCVKAAMQNEKVEFQ